MAQLLSLIINLQSSPDRMATATSEMRQMGLDFERLEAFDGRPYQPDSFAQYDARAAIFMMGRNLNGGEIGCYKSHRNALKRFLQSDAKVCLVLEDDVKFRPGARPVLDWLLGRFENDAQWDLVNLCCRAGRCARLVAPVDGCDRNLMRSYFWPPMTTAILWSRNGAEDFLASSIRITAPVDLFMRRWVAGKKFAYALDRSIVTNSGARPVIDSGENQLPRKHMKGSTQRMIADARRDAVDYALAYYRMGLSWLR